MSTSNRPVFELGLVQAGAISAGAYTAGVVDFLIEAMDAWEKRKDHPDVPHHNVKLKVISGASAGGMTAAITAAALQSEFKPAHLGCAPPEPKKNRLYDAWVTKIDITRLLWNDDLKSKRIVSLLNSHDLSSIAQDALVTVQGEPRSYLADPLVVFLTVANLRGVTYGFKMYADGEYRMQNHMDAMRFSISPAGLHHAEGAICLDPHALFAHGDGPFDQGWRKLLDCALASGAFPIGLAARRLTRDCAEYHSCCCGPIQQEPDWDGQEPAGYTFLAVDGGLMNNEPLQLARGYLAGGFDKPNNRHGHDADRAIILIDPFPNEQPFKANYQPDDRLVSVALRMFSALKAQSRFHALDMELAANDNVYSRFAITPVRRDKHGNMVTPALRAECLGGFGGFLKKAFREHDFHLGRRNCQSFLKRHFCLPEENRLFDEDRWNERLLSRFYVKNDKGEPGKWEVRQPPGHGQATNGTPWFWRIDASESETHRMLPIIPLVSPLDEELPFPPWPAGLSDEEWATIEDAIRLRVERLGSRLIETEIPKAHWRAILGLGWKLFLAECASQFVVARVKSKVPLMH